MARRNKARKINKKMNVSVEVTTRLGAVIVFLFIMVIVNILASSSCQQIQKRIGACEKELARLEDARNRESTRWEEMKTTERVESALRRHGLAMRVPRPEQNVQMNANGQPYPGQLSVAKRLNNVSSNVAKIRTR